MTARVLLRLSAAILLAALSGAVSGALLGAGPAAAHTTLKQSDPAADSTVQALPEVVRLTFSDTLPIAPKVTVRDADGTEVNSSPISPRGNTVLQPVKSAKTGRFTVTWELTSADGHKTTGTFAFTVAGTAPQSSPSATPSASAAPSVVPSPASPRAVVPSNAAESSDSAASGLVWALVIVVLVAVAGGAVLFLRRRRKD